MKIIDCPQLSPQWWEARRGVPTASNFGRIITPKTGKLSASADDYICELLAERTPNYHPGAMTETPMNAAMRHGVQCEPEARRWLEMERGYDVRQVGFCIDDTGRFGCSPDGLVDPDGVIELKAPQLKTQIGYLLGEAEVPMEYLAQVHGQLIVTGRQWVDFLSYAVGARPLLVRVVPNDFTKQLRTVLELFWDRFEAALKRVQGL